MRIGDIQVDPLIDGELVVPIKTFYPPVTSADLEHYDFMTEPVFGEPAHLCTLGGYLVRNGERTIVVDTGIGPNAKSPFVGGGFRSALTAAGVARADVTDVIFSHLHFDHIGWAAIDGRPYFPNATYRVDQRDWEHYCGSGPGMSELEGGFCHPETDAPAVRLAPVADRIEFFAGEQEIMPGLRALEASGHTPGETVLELVSDGEHGLLLGDLVHAQPELIDDNARGQWNFQGHINEPEAIASVHRFRKRLFDQRIPFAAAHFPGLRWARIVPDGARRRWENLGA
jgi:glyoxylase-like metal-dependent hydrolase (beta-lactamase superfamily II)